MNSNETQSEPVKESSLSDWKRTYGTKTLAQIIFGGKDILVDRPRDMVFADYRLLLKGQNKIIRKLFAGPDKNFIPKRLGYNFHLPILPNGSKTSKAESKQVIEPTESVAPATSTRVKIKTRNHKRSG